MPCGSVTRAASVGTGSAAGVSVGITSSAGAGVGLDSAAWVGFPVAAGIEALHDASAPKIDIEKIIQHILFTTLSPLCYYSLTVILKFQTAHRHS
jgi:hypothetical protein